MTYYATTSRNSIVGKHRRAVSVRWRLITQKSISRSAITFSLRPGKDLQCSYIETSKVFAVSSFTPIARSSFSDLVHVKVGPQEQSFFLHYDLLVQSSGYFTLALKSCWIEGQTKTVKLEDDDVEAFKIFTNWLYFRRIEGSQKINLARHGLQGEDAERMFDHDPTDSSNAGPKCLECQVVDHEEAQGGGDMNKATDAGSRDTLELQNSYQSLRMTVTWDYQLVMAYILGDKLQLNDFQNAVINAMEECTRHRHELIGLRAAALAYNNTPASSPLRRYIADLVVHDSSCSYFGESSSSTAPDVPSDFMFDVFTRFKHNQGQDTERYQDFCKKYHVHEEGCECDGSLWTFYHSVFPETAEDEISSAQFTDDEDEDERAGAETLSAIDTGHMIMCNPLPDEED